MIPPNWVLEEIQRLHKWARLGWKGEDRKGPDDELNKGTYVLLQLYHRSDAEKTSVRGRWDDSGPIYGKAFDSRMRVPVMIGKMSKEDVFSGRCIDTLKFWLRPIKDRLIESALAKGKAYDSEVTQLAGEQGEYLYWKANRDPTGASPLITKSDVTEEDKAVLRGERKKDLTKAFMPYKQVEAGKIF